ncbi:Ig-like domain-containing protein [Acetobacter tropicalis]|uniref:Secreted protein n=2 Tax=Acetobacter TaxID=434 RepID=A0A0U5ER43_9PROT|nr:MULTISPECIES: Ig-like domain-containing protein [Acetobacter]ATJ91058.1 hypothetical protein CIW82_10540 [Acetobacter tropicalis]KXV60867.1 hypothetical protein AD948_03645 [Acetobacter senegalensis]MCG4252650.1 Ig-like domain-containing protein [Acetobacter senegalensis]MCG4255906.1 Ig-like domain-containing protein [Acetobacter senegalensis]MCG4259261.1 Ig-like domain-containing protein [Acetobacter senegalensis]
MRLRGIAVLALTGGMLAGCATTSGPVQVGTPNPFGYMKKSAVCSTTPIKTGADGQMSTTMTVRSDDGLCELKISQPSGKSYASFGVSPAPEHGKAFLYSLDRDTHVTYTPTMGYAGTDTFTVILVPGPGEKRTRLTVTAQVDATGVVLPRPVVPAVTAPTETKKTTTTRRRVTTARKK